MTADATSKGDENESSKKITILFLVLIISGCAGKLKYTPPRPLESQNNTVTLAKSKDDVWKEIVPALGKNFFVINNLDKDSGLINISYSGDPQKYIECGRIYSYVKNARGERTYDFPASKATQMYEVMHNGQYALINRTMSLEGRMNIIVEEVDVDNTRVSVNTRYILTKTYSVQQAGQAYPQTHTDSISFNSGQTASFPQGTTCYPNGNFEQEVLSLFH